MTSKLVERAFNEVAKLPEEEQEVVAAWLLEELASEERWQKAFAASEERLGSLAEEALEEHGQGLTEPLEPEKL